MSHPPPLESENDSIFRNCRDCGIVIAILDEVFYTVGKENPGEGQRIWFFCPGCFNGIAGDEFM